MPHIPCAKCQSLIPPSIIIEGKRHSMNRRKYCLACSPFGLRNTRKLDGSPKAARIDHKPKEMVEKAAELAKQGLSQRMIANELGISPSTVSNWGRRGLIPKRNHGEAMKLMVDKGRAKGAAAWTPEARLKQRNNMLRRIAEDPMNHPNRRLAGNRKQMSYPERLVFDSLTAAGILFQHNLRVGRYYPDFVVGKRIFEIDGARWHNPERDAKRDAVLQEMGYTVERFPAKQILKDPHIILHRLQVL
jgi:very-short-patch-repair endonuclease